MADACAEDAFDADGPAAGRGGAERRDRTRTRQRLKIADWLAADAGPRRTTFDAYRDGVPDAATPPAVAQDTDHQEGRAPPSPDAADALRGRGRAGLARSCDAARRPRARATAALLILGAALLEAYDRHKATRALLDYDDLILTSRDLLARPGRRRGCCSSSTAASTTCWSTRPRTPTRTSGKSSAR